MQLRLAVSAIVLLGSSLPSYAQTGAVGPRHASVEQLRQGWRNPPPEARLRCYWWWLNGHTDKPTITHDLEEMKAKGFGGALLVDAGGATQGGNHPVPAGPQFGSPAWTALYLHALKEADRLGLEITLNIQSGWNLGGPDVTPQDASKLLTFNHLDLNVEDGHAQDLRLPQPPTVNAFYRDVAVLAYPLHHGTALAWPSGPSRAHAAGQTSLATPQAAYPPGTRARAAAVEDGMSMENADALLDSGDGTVFKTDPAYADALPNEVRILPMQPDGSVHVALPPGTWELLRVGYTDSGAMVSTSSDTWKGLAIDYMSSQAFNNYWDRHVQPLLVAAKLHRSLKYLATDSWELGGTNWTDNFREEFRRRRGYDPVPYLPVIAGRILGSPADSSKFLADLRRTVADLVVQNHYDLFAARAAAYGLGVQSESGGPHVAPLDALETFRRSAVPQTEFWSQNDHRPADSERFFVKEAASAADIYGQPYAAAEGETSIGPQWSESLASDLKPAFDMAITEGMNRLVWHEFTSSPASAGIPGQEYFAGTHLNPNSTWWNAGVPFFQYLNRVQYVMQQGHAVRDILYFYGGQAPNFVRLKADDPAHVLPTYDYDVTNEDALLHSIHMEGSDLVGPSGVHWKMLVLPGAGQLSAPVLALVARYLKAGGAVVALSPGVATGVVLPAGKTLYANPRAALQQSNIAPDVELASGNVRLAPASSDAIDWVHREVGGRNFYYVRSAYATERRFSLSLRAKGPAELWDPVTGSIYRGEASPAADRTRVDLVLPPFGSVFVVFPGKSTAPSAPAKVREEPAQGTWQLQVPGSAAVPLPTLQPWNELSGSRYFSGTAAYSTTLRMPRLAADETACLHFTRVDVIATLTLASRSADTANGHDPAQGSPAVWAYPYQFCLGPQPGGTLHATLQVTNLWHNRLVGDTLQPAKRTTQTNIVLKPADLTLLPSGLTGPVQWWIYRK
ncbi:glycosyl hydrolase [Acidipila sp. EB88]|uniref:glycosyl hydrolase n=1 Tax=Acidipila sp. EB88 TaxID=2305226 RepID=UPI000F5DF9A2|nr:glycosyl hydrolase [Acidipila sp. EB88]RRA49066.1 glycoside hydrolase [Acidipila sp. EB88]